MATYYLDFVNGNDASAGTSWATAWKTITSGATAARIAPGDTVRIAKSADPTSIGNATWTNKSATVTLGSAQTTNIYLDGAWTAANSGTSTTTTTRKEGSNAASITTAATTAVSTKYAYLTVGGASGLNLSSYDAITFWIRNANAISTNHYQIKLCSDTIGDTAVDTFNIPAVASTTQWVPFTLTRVGGGNLGNAIKSIAWYTGTVSPGNSRNIFIDDVLACTNSSLNLTSLISKNSQAFDGVDTWHGLQSINGTTVILGNENSLDAGSASLRGYYTTGTTPETVTTYVRPTIKFATMASSTTTDLQTLQDDGTSGNLITFSGGWNTSNSTQDGETWVDGQNGYGRFLLTNAKKFNKIERLCGVRFNNLIAPNQATESTDNIFEYIVAANCTDYGFILGGWRNIITKLTVNNNFSGCNFTSSSPSTGYTNSSTIISKSNSNGSQIFGHNHYFNEFYVYYEAGFTLQANGENFLNKLVIDSSPGTAISTINTGRIYVEDGTITNNLSSISNGWITFNRLTASGNTNLNGAQFLTVKNMNAATNQLIGSVMPSIPASNNSSSIQPNVFYSNINNVQTDNRAYWVTGNALSQTTTRKTASGIAWQINITNTMQNSDKPCYFPIAKIACNANSLVTVKAWVKLSHATDIGAKLLIKGYEIAGVTADVTATKSADTNWEELTITFTPTIAGVAQIYLQAYWLANLADESVFVDDITVTQA